MNLTHFVQVFDNRGALKRHRTDAHPELEEFKPVDLENDDPDRAQVDTISWNWFQSTCI